jgi:hypothetical protein
MSGSGLDGIAEEARGALGGDGAREGDFIPAGGAEKTDDQKKEDEAREWASVPYVLGGLLARAMPELQAVYSESACLDWGRATVPVARKYGWSLGRFTAEFSWIGATWGLLAPAFAAFKQRRDNANKRPVEAGPEARPEPEPAARTHPDGSPIG